MLGLAPGGWAATNPLYGMASKLTYKEAGVDTEQAAALVGEIKTHVQRTQKQRQLMGAFGLFAAAFELKGYREPVIVTGCDGVGTKLEVLLEYDRIEDAGKDLVAMSVNDILTTGGDPLMFLDYIGLAKLDDALVTRLVLKNDRAMEYVHLKDLRGSGTEPVNVLSGYRWQDGFGYYEVTRDTASHFFIDRLPAGTHVFESSVRVQHAGTYQTGVAEIRCMYAPEFNAHSGSVELTAEP